MGLPEIPPGGTTRVALWVVWYPNFSNKNVTLEPTGQSKENLPSGPV